MPASQAARLGYVRKGPNSTNMLRLEKKLNKYLKDNAGAERRLAEVAVSSAVAAALAAEAGEDLPRDSSDPMERLRIFNKDLVKYDQGKKSKEVPYIAGSEKDQPGTQHLKRLTNRNRATLWDVNMDRALEMKNLLEERERYFNGEMDDKYYKIGPDGYPIDIPPNVKIRRSTPTIIVTPVKSECPETPAQEIDSLVPSVCNSRSPSNVDITYDADVSDFATKRVDDEKRKKSKFIRKNRNTEPADAQIEKNIGDVSEQRWKMDIVSEPKENVNSGRSTTQPKVIPFNHSHSNFMPHKYRENLCLPPPLPLPEPSAVVNIGKLVAPGIPPPVKQPKATKEPPLDKMGPSISSYRRRHTYKKKEGVMSDLLAKEEIKLKESAKPKKEMDAVKMSGERVYETMTMGPVRRLTASEIDNTYYPQSSLKVYMKRSQEFDKDPSQPHYLKPKSIIPFASLERLETVKETAQVNLWLKQHDEITAQEGKEKTDRHNREILTKSKVEDSFQEIIGRVEAGDYQKDPRYKELLGMLKPFILPCISEWRQQNSPQRKVINFSSSLLHKYGYRYKNEEDL